MRLFFRAVQGGVAVGVGALILMKIATVAVSHGPGWFIAVIALAFVMATLFKIFFSARMYTHVTLTMPLAVLNGVATRASFVACVIGAVAGNLIGAAAVAVLAHRGGWLTDGALLEAIATKKSGGSFMTLLAQGVLCNWSLMLAAWACVRVTSLGARGAILGFSFFFFVCSGYEHGVVNVALLILANLAPHGESVTWAGVFANVAPVVLGNLTSGALVSLFGYYAMRAPTQIPTLVTGSEARLGPP